MGTNRDDAEKTELELYVRETLCDSCGGKTTSRISDTSASCPLCSTPLHQQRAPSGPSGVGERSDVGLCEGCGGPKPADGGDCETCTTPQQVSSSPVGDRPVPPPLPLPQPRRGGGGDGSGGANNGNKNTRRQLFKEDDDDGNENLGPEEDIVSLPSTSSGCRSSVVGATMCQLCRRAFPSSSRLAQHLADHHQSSSSSPPSCSARPFQCPTCPKAFSSKFKLVRHSLIHSDQRQYTCGECDRTFHRKDHLKNHAKVHSPTKRRYACRRPACSKEYSSALSLRKHEAGHAAEEGDLECKMCGQIFDTKEAILFHLKVHAGSRTVKTPADKKYRCDYCDRRFFTGKDVRRHSVVHTGRRDFLCQACPQRFGRKDHLVRHMKKSHAAASSLSDSGATSDAAGSGGPSWRKKTATGASAGSGGGGGKRSGAVKTATSIIEEVAAAASAPHQRQPPTGVPQGGRDEEGPQVKDEPRFPTAISGQASGTAPSSTPAPSGEMTGFALPPELVVAADTESFMLASFLAPDPPDLEDEELEEEDEEDIAQGTATTTTLPTFEQAFPPPPKPPS